MHARRTAAIATCFSVAYGIDIRVKNLKGTVDAKIDVYVIGRVRAVKGRPWCMESGEDKIGM